MKRQHQQNRLIWHDDVGFDQLIYAVPFFPSLFLPRRSDPDRQRNEPARAEAAVWAVCPRVIPKDPRVIGYEVDKVFESEG